LFAASNVSAPSFDTSQRYRTIYKNLDIAIECFDSKGSDIEYDSISPNSDEIVIGILGELTKHKGLDFVRELTAAANGLKIRFEIFGSIPAGSSLTGRKVRVHGKYRDFAELKLRVQSSKPDLFLFPGRIPETYSYTLTEALRFGIPIAYFRTGAIADRLTNVSRGIPFELDAKPEQIIDVVKMRLALLQRGK
jgi:glycosyltransferase involved in cell wall biosynthesis